MQNLSQWRAVRCDGNARRDFLKVGCLSAFGLAITDLVRARQANASLRNKADHCILVWLDGGPSHLDMFDLKPQAPAEVRGPFQPIDTNVAGVQISEWMPSLAKQMDKVALIRSMTSPLGEHNLGAAYLTTGYKPTPVLEYPALGSVFAHLHRPPTGGRVLPGHIAVPDFRIGGGNLSGRGFLPASAAPFSVESDPAKRDFRVHDLDFYLDVTRARIDRRREFLQALDRFNRTVESNPPHADSEFEQAYRLATSREAKEAFNLDREPPALRQRYGSRTIGQCCLLARRLVERGVPFVTVNHRGWDTHTDMYTRLKEGYTGAKVPVGLLPSLDQTLGALIGDLADRGLLKRTLVLVMGEFGRTPKLNTFGGRDHWPRVFSVLTAGGGVPGGQVIGSSDAVGESPRERPIRPEDLTATVYTLLGVDPTLELHTPDGRPVRLTSEAHPIREIVE